MKAIGFPFHLSPNGKVAETRGYPDLVRGQIIDALMTNQGERVFRALYGCDIQAALFDPSDELVRRDMGGIIKGRLQQFVPRAIVRDVAVTVADAHETHGHFTSDLGPQVVYIDVVYRPNLFATDQAVRVPVSSEFITRQQSIQEGPAA